MQINECSYCGLWAIIENGMCYNCQKALGQTEIVQRSNLEDDAEISSASPDNNLSYSSENESYADSSQTEFNPEKQIPPRYAAENSWEKCSVCNIGVVRHGEVCRKCSSQNTYKIESKSGGTSLFGKIAAVFVLVIIAAGVGFYYFYYSDSAYYVNRKFEKATGLTSNIVLDSVEVTGTAQMGLWNNAGWEMTHGQDLSFQLNFQKPGKSLIDFRQIVSEKGFTAERSIVKQGFDGTTGWKLTHPPDKPAILENADNDFGNDFLDGDETGVSYTVLDKEEVMKSENDPKIFMNTRPKIIKFFEENIKTFKVNGVEKQSVRKTYLIVTKKSATRTRSVLLVFDEDSGFLVGASKSVSLGFLISFDEYERFLVQENGFLGKSKKSVLIPTAVKYKIGGNIDEISGRPYDKYKRYEETPVLIINLKLKNFTIDKVISDALFEKPVLPAAPVANRNF